MQDRRTICALLLTWLFLATENVFALENVLQPPEEFVHDVFAGDVPKPEVLWLTKDLANEVADILGHPSQALRLRYWERNKRSAWILDEIGKERPITTGVVVDNGKIERIKVLIYRETRGHEVQYAFFTDQFKGAQLRPDKQLDRSIDSISGATLSVRALTKLARLALRLDHYVQSTKSGS